MRYRCLSFEPGTWGTGARCDLPVGHEPEQPHRATIAGRVHAWAGSWHRIAPAARCVWCREPVPEAGTLCDTCADVQGYALDYLD